MRQGKNIKKVPPEISYNCNPLVCSLLELEDRLGNMIALEALV
jgi:hypothetical protein